MSSPKTSSTAPNGARRSRSSGDIFKNILGSAFGLGLLPVAPGTFGALLGLAWHLAALSAGLSGLALRGACLAGALLWSAVHYALTPWAQAYWNDSDPGHFVLDEVVGYLCVPLLSLETHDLRLVLLGFLLVRVFDIIKLPGARYIDRNIHTASGVLFDDVVSAVYAAAVLSLVIVLRA